LFVIQGKKGGAASPEEVAKLEAAITAQV